MLRSRSGSWADEIVGLGRILLEVEQLPLESVQHVDRRMPLTPSHGNTAGMVLAIQPSW